MTAIVVEQQSRFKSAYGDGLMQGSSYRAKQANQERPMDRTKVETGLGQRLPFFFFFFFFLLSLPVYSVFSFNRPRSRGRLQIDQSGCLNWQGKHLNGV
jgi:hypothetical protein